MLEGEWTGHFLTPGGEVASTTYRVVQDGSDLVAAMEFGGRRFTLVDYHVDGKILTFTMDAGFVMDCRFEQQATRQYKGACVDPKGNVGPAVIGPPGVTAEPMDIDIDTAFDVWDLSREEYERERIADQPASQESDLQAPEPLPTRMVDVGDYSLNVADLGSGDVTVVLVSGVGDDHRVWQQVQEETAKRTRVLSYDRAGIGQSDTSPVPRSPEAMARELRDLLDSQDIEPPYLLVGHEAGGFIARQFRALYPNEVAGLVLVDPAHEKEEEMWAAVDADSRSDYLSRKRAFLSTISDAAAREFEAFHDDIPSDEPPEALMSSTTPDVPVFVLSGLRPSETPRWIGEAPEGLEAKEELYRSLAEELGGEFMASAKSGRHVHMEDPHIVVDAINRILDAIEQ